MQTDPTPAVVPADVEDLKVDGGPTGSVRVRIVRPAGASGVLPVIVYVHGLGWVFGGPETHDRLIRELAAGTDAAVRFAGQLLYYPVTNADFETGSYPQFATGQAPRGRRPRHHGPIRRDHPRLRRPQPAPAHLRRPGSDPAGHRLPFPRGTD